MDSSYSEEWHDPIYKRLAESELGIAGHTSGLVPVAETQAYFGVSRETTPNLYKKKILIDFWFNGQSKTITTNVNYHRTKTRNHAQITGNLMPAYKAAGAVEGDIVIFWKSKADENYFRAELLKQGSPRANNIGTAVGGTAKLSPPPSDTNEEITDDYEVTSDVEDSISKDDFPTEKRKGRMRQGARLITLRNKAKGDFVLKQQNYQCQVDPTHTSFLTRNEKPYMEKHHLISMKFYEEYENDLDDISNIVSLCPTCHRKIHLGKKQEIAGMLEILFERQKDLLSAAGFSITLEELKKKYGAI